jgi:hypothetical protein
MAFEKMFPSRGTVIPEGHRPHGSTNAALHELPAFREYTHDLIGVVLYLPRSKHVVVPFRHQKGGGAGCVIVEGDKTYPRGGYDIDVSHWELQRAERVAIRVPRRQVAGAGLEKTLRSLANGDRVWVEVEQPITIEPDPVCVKCGVWLTRPGHGVNFTVSPNGPECLPVSECETRQDGRGEVYRAPVRS